MSLSVVFNKILKPIAMCLLGTFFLVPAVSILLKPCTKIADRCVQAGGGVWIWILAGSSLVLVISGLLQIGLVLSVVKDVIQKSKPAKTITLQSPPPSSKRVSEPIMMKLNNPIQWLSEQNPTIRNFIALHWNWDFDMKILRALIDDETCDAGVAANVFWLSGVAEDYIPFGDAEPEDNDDIFISEMQRAIALRFVVGGFKSGYIAYEFDWDENWPAKLLAAYRAGKIDWDPSRVPLKVEGIDVDLSAFDLSKQSEIRSFMDEYGVGLG